MYKLIVKYVPEYISYVVLSACCSHWCWNTLCSVLALSVSASACTYQVVNNFASSYCPLTYV